VSGIQTNRRHDATEYTLRRSAAALACLLVTAAAHAATPAQPITQERLNALVVPFEANSGQFDRRVAFAARTFTGNLYVTRDGALVHSLLGATKDTPRQEAPGRRAAPQRSAGWSLVERPVMARQLEPEGSDASNIAVARFTGNDAAHWQSHIATFDRVEMGEVWPGISLSLVARGANVEKIFTLASNVEVERIAMRVDGATLAVASDGALTAQTGNGPVSFTAPVAWQFAEGGERVPVAVSYRLDDASTYGFALGAFDPAYPVVIDPLVQATYLGGSGTDDARALAVDASGNVVIAGYTQSADFPGTTGGYQSGGGGIDAFVARLNSGLTSLTKAVYFGGGAGDVATALRIDATGNVFVAGYTFSSNFPVTVGTAQTTKSGDATTTDAFIVRFNSALTSLERGTYLGGSDTDAINALVVDGTNVLVAGQTASANFPGTSGATQAALGGKRDAFLARLTADLALTRATYLGGSADDEAFSLAISGTTLYVAGYTASTNFPAGTTSAGVFTSNAGGIDGFVARFTTSLLTRSRTTYLGGAGEDMALGIAVDTAPTPNVVVVGYTESTNFPAGTSGTGAQIASGGGADAFAARFNDTLTTMFRSSYLGGGSTDVATAVMVHPNGDIYVTGFTSSDNDPGPPFPGVKSAASCTSPCTVPGAGSGVQSDSAGSMDVFVTRFNSTLATHTQSTYLGGSQGDAAYAIAAAATPASPGNDVLIAGYTGSSNFRGTAGGAQPAYGGKGDVFVALLSLGLQDAAGDQKPNSFKFIDQVNSPLNSVIVSAPVQITGINVATPIAVTGGEYCISATNSCGACTFTSAAGTITNNQYVCVRHTSAATNSAITRTTLTVFGDTSTFSSTTSPAVADTDPASFTFGTRTNVTTGAQIVGVPVQVTGINIPAAISIAGDGNSQYCISSASDPVTPCACDVQAYGNAAGTVYPGQFVCARHDASGSPATQTASTVTIGTVAGSLTSTTLASGADTDPAAFPFANQTNVPLMVAVTSAPVQISGIDTPAPISVSGGQYCISSGADCGCNVRFYSAVASTISNGQHVCVKHTTPGVGLTATNTTVTVGAVSSTFTSTTGASDAVPDAFSFVNQSSVPLATLVVSAPVQITGINTQVMATVSGAAGSAYCISSANDCGCDVQQFTTTSAPVTNGRYMCVRHTSAGAAGAQTSTSLDVGGVGATFTSTTTQPGFVLTVSRNGTGAGSVTSQPAGISCGVDCSESYTGGTPVVLTATADGGSAFSAWSGCDSVTGNQCNVTVNAARLVTATFDSSVVARLDFNDDGRADILLRNTSTGENYLYPMNGTTILGTEGYIRTVPSPWDVAGVGDFDGNGTADILLRNSSTGENYIYFMNGTAIANEGYVRTVPLAWSVAGVADMDGDGKADILLRDASTGENYLYPMDGLSIKGTEGYIRTVASPWTVAGLADFNGDGRADILLRNTSTGENYLYPMNGTTILGSEGYIRTVPLAWDIAGLGDFDGDGRADILLRNTSTGENYLYPMDGTTIKGTEGYIRTVPATWVVASIADFDGDGKVDILLRNSSTGENYLYPMDGLNIKPTEGYIRTVPIVWSVVGK
jgi:hypothetical protein